MDLAFAPHLFRRNSSERMAKPKLHWNPIFANGPLTPAFARLCAQTAGERQNPTAGKVK
jgi:hypothetical protein